MILMLNAKQIFKMSLWQYDLGIFIVVILAPGCEFFSAKCTPFPLTFAEWN